MDGWELAHNQEQDIEGRKEMNIRGMVLKSELDEDGVAPMRVGQCWEMNDIWRNMKNWRKHT